MLIGSSIVNDWCLFSADNQYRLFGLGHCKCAGLLLHGKPLYTRLMLNVCVRTTAYPQLGHCLHHACWWSQSTTSNNSFEGPCCSQCDKILCGDCQEIQLFVSHPCSLTAAQSFNALVLLQPFKHIKCIFPSFLLCWEAGVSKVPINKAEMVFSSGSQYL